MPDDVTTVSTDAAPVTPPVAEARSDETHTARTTRTIAYLLIGLYGAGLLVIGIRAAVMKDPDDAWLELFKSGFLILGGGLTTIIGYYFGSRGTEEAQQTADAALKQVEKTSQELIATQREIRQLQEIADNLRSMAPTYDEESLELADDISPAEEI